MKTLQEAGFHRLPKLNENIMSFGGNQKEESPKQPDRTFATKSIQVLDSFPESENLRLKELRTLTDGIRTSRPHIPKGKAKPG